VTGTESSDLGSLEDCAVLSGDLHGLFGSRSDEDASFRVATGKNLLVNGSQMA
jgi:hypothetical protein